MCTTKKAPTCTLFWYTLVLLNFNLCGTQVHAPSFTSCYCAICPSPCIYTRFPFQSYVLVFTIRLPGLRHLLNLKLPTNRRNAVFFCQILSFYLLYGVVSFLELCYNKV